MHNRSDRVREATWIFAASQLLVLCMPIALRLVKAVAIGVVALLAVVALISSSASVLEPTPRLSPKWGVAKR